MTIISPYIDNLKRIKDRLPEIATEAVRDNMEVIIYTIVELQLSQGKDWTGKVVGVYKPRTQDFYAQNPTKRPRKEKIAGAPYNFDWTGSFIEGIYIKTNNDESYDIMTRDGKLQLLNSEFSKYRSWNVDLLRLTEKHNRMINDTVILPLVYKYILNNLLSA